MPTYKQVPCGLNKCVMTIQLAPDQWRATQSQQVARISGEYINVQKSIISINLSKDSERCANTRVSPYSLLVYGGFLSRRPTRCLHFNNVPDWHSSCQVATTEHIVNAWYAAWNGGRVPETGKNIQGDRSELFILSGLSKYSTLVHFC